MNAAEYPIISRIPPRAQWIDFVIPGRAFGRQLPT